MNETLMKFGYPESVIKSYSHWSVLLRPQQVTLGSLILASHSQSHAFSALESPAMQEMAIIIKDIESALTRCFKYDKINYLMLMMVDPHVHFHVIPRYKDFREFESLKITDSAWPGPPNLGHEIALSEKQMQHLRRYLVEQWSLVDPSI